MNWNFDALWCSGNTTDSDSVNSRSIRGGAIINDERITAVDTKEEAKKYKVYPLKYVGTHFTVTNIGNTTTARKWIKEIQDFLDANNLEDAKITVEVSGCMGCGGSLDYISIGAEVNKTDEELQVEIAVRKARETENRASAKKQRELKKACDRATYERLKKVFEKKDKNE